MPAADRLAAAAPTSELRDMELGNAVADATAGGTRQPPRRLPPRRPMPRRPKKFKRRATPLVVVRVHAKRTALERKTFDRLLSAAALRWIRRQPMSPDSQPWTERVARLAALPKITRQTARPSLRAINLRRPPRSTRYSSKRRLRPLRPAWTG